MSKDPVLIIGARSDIGRATAQAFAARGHPLALAARDADAVARERADLAVRYQVPVTGHVYDVLDNEGPAAFVESLPALPGVVVCLVGAMGNQAENQVVHETARHVMRCTFEGPALVLAELANRMQARGSGTLVGVSSVAGERGRAKNYVYGAAKAGLTAFLSGLRNRLASRGVHVVTVLPGFVQTRMTAGMDLPHALTAQPRDVALAIVDAVEKRRDVIYVFRIWRLIMLVIRNIPEALFKRLHL